VGRWESLPCLLSTVTPTPEELESSNHYTTAPVLILFIERFIFHNTKPIYQQNVILFFLKLFYFSIKKLFLSVDASRSAFIALSDYKYE